MLKAATKRDVLWGYLAQGLNIGAGIILLPVIVHYLSEADVGLWLVFVTLASLAQLLEFGFQPTIARNVAYVYAGARELSRSSVPDRGTAGQQPDLALLASLFRASKRIYMIVAGLAGVILVVGGTLYVYSLLTPAQNTMSALLGWMTFGFGYVVTFYYGYFNSFLSGRGDVGLSNKVLVITRGGFIVLGMIAVISGFGLLGLGAASLLAAAMGRWAAHHFYMSKAVLKPADAGRFRSSDRDNVSTIWHNASRLGLVQLGSFLILRANILIASSMLGLELASSYSLTVTVFLAVSSVATVVCQTQVPYMSVLQAKRDVEELRGVYGQIVMLAWGVYLGGFVAVILFGKFLLPLISQKAGLLPLPMLLAMGAVQFLELNHSVAATYLTTTNQVPFWKASLCSGAAILLLGLSLVGRFGVWAPIIAQGLVQLAYNNWKWPFEVSRDLRANGAALLASGYRRLTR